MVSFEILLVLEAENDIESPYRKSKKIFFFEIAVIFRECDVAFNEFQHACLMLQT